MCLLPGDAWPGGVSAPRGVSGGCLVPPPDSYCCGRYASYWNAFLFGDMSFSSFSLVMHQPSFTAVDSK